MSEPHLVSLREEKETTNVDMQRAREKEKNYRYFLYRLKYRP